MYLVKYLVLTPWAQIKADWREYKNICSWYKKAEDEEDMAHAAITYRCQDNEFMLKAPGCVKYQMAMQRCADVSDNMCDIRMQYCSEFNRTYNENGCYLSDCPYAEKNRVYHAARQELEKMKAIKKDFWKQKLINMK